jgi:hypothetical protein
MLSGRFAVRDKIIEALEQEIAVLNSSWQLAIGNTLSCIKSYEGRQVSTHLGHNLGNRAAELSEIAAKIDQTQRILAFVREN